MSGDEGANPYWSGNPERGEQSIDDFWEEAHEKRDGGWLTGSPGIEEWRNLRVLSLIRAGIDVLNIGVGLGRGTLALCDTGCRVTAVDISTHALDRVRPRVAGIFPADELGSLPHRAFDLALSHLVAQHMSDDDLLSQMTNVIRSLRESGRFAMQFIAHWDQDSATRNDTLEWRKRGGVTRTLARVAMLVEKAGGRIIHAEAFRSFHIDRVSAYTIHIVPKAGFHRYGDQSAQDDAPDAAHGGRKESATPSSDLAGLRERAEAAERSLATLVSSRSWRVTAPLRWGARMLRRIPGLG